MAQNINMELVPKIEAIKDIFNGETIPKIKAAIDGAEEICKEQGSVKLQKSVAACKEGIYQFLEVNSELLESFDKVVEYYKKTDAALN